MQEKEIRTGFKQRIFIGIIAALMLITFVAVYALIVIGGNSSSSSSSANIDDAKVSELYSAYETAQAAVDEEAVNWSNTYFSEFVNYKSQVSSFNSESVESGDLTTEDLKVGDGAEITENTDYYAYYIGWCADGTILDSSLDDTDNPTSLVAPLEASNLSLIDGWTEGVIGMNIGGVRLLSIPSDMAYADEEVEACGGSNVPLKFVVMAVEPSEPLISLYETLNDAYNEYYVYSNTGLTYDEYVEQYSTSE